MSNSDNLTELDIQIITFVHQFWGLNREFLTKMVAFEEYGIPEEVYEATMRKEAVRTDLLRRGLPERSVNLCYKEIVGTKSAELEDIWLEKLKSNTLTPKQLLVANTLLDLTDTRAHKKKLQDNNVSTAEYQSWLVDGVFTDYLRKRAEDMHGETIHEAHLALQDKVRAGDMSAIKYFMEMNNIYVEKSKTNDNAGMNPADFQRIIVNLIEIIQDEVDDPNVMIRISERIRALASANQTANSLTNASSVNEERAIIVPKIAKAREMTPEMEQLLDRSTKNESY